MLNQNQPVWQNDPKLQMTLTWRSKLTNVLASKQKSQNCHLKHKSQSQPTTLTLLGWRSYIATTWLRHWFCEVSREVEIMNDTSLIFRKLSKLKRHVQVFCGWSRGYVNVYISPKTFTYIRFAIIQFFHNYVNWAFLWLYVKGAGELAQWLRHWIFNRMVSSSSPALPTVLRVRDISNLSSHTVTSAECTGNCAWGLNEELTIAVKSRANKVWITLP